MAILVLLLLLCLPRVTLANITVNDDAGNILRLTVPAKRVVSLAPHITELLFETDAGNKIVGTVRFSDYPESAKNIPLVGDSYNLDFETIIALQPDLIIVWKTGTGRSTVEKLHALGYTVFISEPDSLEIIATSVERFGKLTGNAETALTKSKQFQQDVVKLKSKYSTLGQVRVFYQFWNQPIFTVNENHIISTIIEMCGGKNVFAELSTLTPQLSVESVLNMDPDVIIASGEGNLKPEWLEEWRQWPTLTAVSNDQIYSIPPEIIQRHTTRILDGARMMCEFIDNSRH